MKQIVDIDSEPNKNTNEAKETTAAKPADLNSGQNTLITSKNNAQLSSTNDPKVLIYNPDYLKRKTTLLNSSPSNSPYESRTIYGRCRLPVIKDTQMVRFSDKCSSQFKELTIRYKPTGQKDPEIYKHSFKETETNYILNFLAQINYGKMNHVEFKKETCTLEISKTALTKIAAIAVLIIKFS